MEILYRVPQQKKSLSCWKSTLSDFSFSLFLFWRDSGVTDSWSTQTQDCKLSYPFPEYFAD